MAEGQAEIQNFFFKSCAYWLKFLSWLFIESSHSHLGLDNKIWVSSHTSVYHHWSTIDLPSMVKVFPDPVWPLEEKKSRYVRMWILKISFTLSSNNKLTTSASINLMEWLNRWYINNKINDSFKHFVLHCRVIVLYNLTMFIVSGYILTIQSPVATNLTDSVQVR